MKDIVCILLLNITHSGLSLKRGEYCSAWNYSVAIISRIMNNVSECCLVLTWLVLSWVIKWLSEQSAHNRPLYVIDPEIEKPYRQIQIDRLSLFLARVTGIQFNEILLICQLLIVFRLSFLVEVVVFTTMPIAWWNTDCLNLIWNMCILLRREKF